MQPAPVVVVTEPAAEQAAEPVASIEASAPATQAGPTLLLDNEEQRAFFAEWNARADECHKQQQEWEATRAERCAIQQAEYYTVTAGKYELTCQTKNGLAIDCSCPSRSKKLRFQGVACKHQMAHNATLKTAEAA